MAKILIIESCIINLGDDRGGVDHAVGATAEVTKDTAYALACAGRALYVDPKDDPSKGSHHTASKAMLKAAADVAKAKAPAAPAAPGSVIDPGAGSGAGSGA